MKRFDVLLAFIVLLEVASGTFLFVRRNALPRLPIPPLAKSDALRSDIEALAADCTVPEDVHRLAEVYTAYGFYREADACYKYLLSRQPDDPQLLLESGFLLSQMGRCLDASVCFAAALEAGHPAPAECWYLAGRNFLRAEQPAKAANAFSNAGELVSARLELARLRYRDGDASGAMTLLGPILKIESDKIGPNTLAYLCMLELGDVQTATKYAEHAADTTQRLFNPFYTHRERLSAAIPLIGYRRRFSQGEEYAIKNQMEIAESLWQEARSVEWNDFSVGFLAALAARKGDHERAIALLQEIVVRRGPSSVPLGTLANVYFDKGDTSRAIDTMLQAIEAQSEEDLVDEFGKLTQWSELLGRANDAQHYANLQTLNKGKMAFWNADWTKAQSLLLSASERMQESDEVWFFLGETYRRLNESDKATAAYELCLSLKPQHGGAHRGMAILGKE